MERPTCKTCPYWDLVDEDSMKSVSYDEFMELHPEEWENVQEGECRRYPLPHVEQRVFTREQIENRSPCAYIINAIGWPQTVEYDWCGEHPDFPEYIASLKESQSPPRIRSNASLEDFVKLGPGSGQDPR